MTSAYVSFEARDKVLAAYDERLRMLSTVRDVEVRDIETSFGSTRVLLLGPETAPPLVILHGAQGDAVQMATALGSLTVGHRCAFVDVPGEPNRSTEEQPPLHDDSLGRWMVDLLDALAFGAAAMWGMSGGGYIVLRCAASIPERITAAVLVVPAGLIPMETIPEATAHNARTLVNAITGPDSGLPHAAIDQLVAQTRLVLGAIRTPFGLIGPSFTAEELARFRAPVFVAAGAMDAIFPGGALLERARAVLPNVDEELLLPYANHIHLEWVFDGPFVDAARRFLAAKT